MVLCIRQKKYSDIRSLYRERFADDCHETCDTTFIVNGGFAENGLFA